MSLLTRPRTTRASAPGPRVPQHPDERAREATLAVVENLRAVLNTKQGHGHFLEGFGLADYFQQAADQATTTLLHELEGNLARFEPRLVGARVELVGRDLLWLAFRVTGTIVDRPRALDLYFHATFGTVRVEVVDG
jgi:predicted component of type VI protein secretion system